MFRLRWWEPGKRPLREKINRIKSVNYRTGQKHIGSQKRSLHLVNMNLVEHVSITSYRQTKL